jgi:hypothetical protein
VALVAETGAIVAGANCYALEAVVNTYLSEIGTPAAWTAANTASREAAILKATRFLDSQYRALFIGARTSSAQELEWPRTGAYTRDDFLLPSRDAGSIPKELTWATAELASRYVSADLVPDRDDLRQVNSETLSVGPISLGSSFGESSPARSFTKTEWVDLLLGRLLRATRPGLRTVEIARA